MNRRSLFRALCATGISLAALAEAPAQEGPKVLSGHVPVENGRLYYEAAGEGEAVLLLHDGILHRESWNAQFPGLASRCRLVRYDRRGFGRSDAPKAPYSNVADLLELYKALGIERAALIGCSSGGQLALDFALEHPGKVTALLLEGAVVSGAPLAVNLFLRGGRLEYGRRLSPADATDYWCGTDPFFMAPESVEARAQARALLTANPQNWAPEKGRLASEPRRPALPNLGEVKVPALLVTGEFDIADVHAEAGMMEAGIPGARRVVVPRSGHLVHLEQPAQFNEIVRDFLDTGRLLFLLRTREPDASGAFYKELRARTGGVLPLDEEVLNIEGYQLLMGGRAKQAVAAFQICAETYPDSWNAHDSLGEALMADGQREASIRSYRRSLELNPGNDNAREALKRLGAPVEEKSSKP